MTAYSLSRWPIYYTKYILDNISLKDIQLAFWAVESCKESMLCHWDEVDVSKKSVMCRMMFERVVQSDKPCGL